MGDVVPFRKKPRWTRPEDYGHEGTRGGGGKPPRGPRRDRRSWRALAFWLAALTGITVWVGSDPMLIAPPDILASEPQVIDGRFTRCGLGRGAYCVIDGDTFKLGERKIRIVGIDAPETIEAQCDGERALGEAATAELQRLLNLGKFTMVGRIDDPRDKYGRELRALSRVRPDGSVQSIADDLVASGKVRAYRSGLRAGWCGAPAE